MIQSRRRIGILCALLFFSGAAALADEVVWVRLLTDVFGTTAGATAVVLACFMAGMGGGALVFGRAADRVPSGVRLYAFLELGAGALACLVPLFVRLSGFVYGWVFRTAGPGGLEWLTLARVVLSALVLVPPAFLLGGTLPALVRALARASDELGPSIGKLYAANTAGAVFGCFVTGYVLVPALGVLGTVFLAAGASLAVGAAALAISRGAGFAALAHESDDTLSNGSPMDIPEIPPLRRWAMPVLYGGSGFAAMGCEVLWTRALVFVLRSTVYAFTSMLTVFLVGLAAGGLIGARVARAVRKPALTFACVEAGVAASVGLSLLTLRAFAARWVSLDIALGSEWAVSTLLHLLVALAVMLVPTVLFGMAFPLAGRLHAPVVRSHRRAHGEAAGRATGELLLGNTVGGVAGALAAGFVLAPLVGTAYSILALAGLALFVAAGAMALLTRARYGIKVRAFVGAGLVAITVFATVPQGALEGLFAAPNPKAELKYVREDPTGIVTVHRYADTGHLALSADGVPVAGTAPPLRSTQVLQALIPTLLHPRPARVLQVGLGSGETARIALSRAEEFRDARYTAVEISPAVVHAARKFFEPLSGGVLMPSGRLAAGQAGCGTRRLHETEAAGAPRSGEPRASASEHGEAEDSVRGRAAAADEARFSLVVADGATYVRHSRLSARQAGAGFDLVLTESTYPFLSGSSGLYTLDYFRRVRAILAPGGTVSCWLPLDVPERALRSVLRTFGEAFPHAALWTTSRHGYKHALLLGSVERLEIPYARLKRRSAESEVARLLKFVGIRSADELAACLMLDRAGIAEFAAGAPLHTRNRPVLEYETALRSARNWRQRLARNFEAMAPLRTSPTEHVDFGGLEPEERAAAVFRLELAARESRARWEALAGRLAREGDAFPSLARARAAREDGDESEAIRLYRRALEIAPGWDEVAQELGLFYLELGMLEEARELTGSPDPPGPTGGENAAPK